MTLVWLPRNKARPGLGACNLLGDSQEASDQIRTLVSTSWHQAWQLARVVHPSRPFTLQAGNRGNARSLLLA